MQIFNAKTQRLEDVIWSVDRNNELICTFAGGHFYKLPAGTTRQDIEIWAIAHQEANEGQEVITPEAEAAQAAQRDASDALVNELNGEPHADSTANPPAAPPAAPQSGFPEVV